MKALPIAAASLGFAVSLGTGLLLRSEKSEVQAPSLPVSVPRLTDSPASPDLLHTFLGESAWDGALSAAADDDLLRLLQEIQPDYWNTSATAESASYRLFGAIAQRAGLQAIGKAIERLGGKGAVSQRSKWLQFAVVGIAENTNVEWDPALFASFSEPLWPQLIQGLVTGSDLGDIGQDVRRLPLLTEPILKERGRKEIKNKVLQLNRKTVRAWLERDPLQTIRWLQTEEGRPYLNFLPAALAFWSIGRGEGTAAEMEQLCGDVDVIAGALYFSGGDPEAIKEFGAKLSSSSRQSFFSAYAKRLARGSPRTQIEYVMGASAEMLTDEAAAHLAPAVFQLVPGLLEKLTGNMKPLDRGRLLDERCFNSSFALTPEAAAVYLGIRGADGPYGTSAVVQLASRDLPTALKFAELAPPEKRDVLIRDAYAAHAVDLSRSGASVDAVVAACRGAPAATARQAAIETIQLIAYDDPEKALEILGKGFSDSPEVWASVFADSVFIPSPTLDAFLEHKIKEGIDPATYSAAAVRMAKEFSRENVQAARVAVEALPENDVKNQCTVTLISRWGGVDPLSALGYVSDLPAGTRRDLAIGALASFLKFAPQKQNMLLDLVSSAAVRDTLQERLQQSE